MFRAHELVSVLIPDCQDYNDCIVSVKFDLGDLDDVFDLSDLSTKTFFEIPAPICLFQVTQDSDIHFFLAKQDCGGTIWRCFHKTASNHFKWWQEDLEFFIEGDGKTLIAQRISENKFFGKFKNGEEIIDNYNEMTDSEQWTLTLYINVAMSIEVFSCSNVTTVENKPPRFINAKRSKKGKIPFFSYRTLHITGENNIKAEINKGTHASPRLHLRRGHIRKLGEGRRVWVSACLVGDKSKGFASHDYSVQTANLPCKHLTPNP